MIVPFVDDEQFGNHVLRLGWNVFELWKIETVTTTNNVTKSVVVIVTQERWQPGQSVEQT